MIEEQAENKREGTNKGGRKKLPEEQKKVPFSLKLSAVDKKQLRNKYARHKGIKETFREYLRSILLNKDVHVLYYEKGRLEIIRELAAIGNNINQIAKHLNEKGYSQELNNNFLKLTKEIEEVKIKMYGPKDK